jgi:ABC-2 type transport system permease protein
VRFAYGVPIAIHDWPAFLVGVAATIGSIGALGFVLASALVRYRSAFMIGNVFEWPVWMICGLLIPVAALPGWLQPVSWALAPTWGMRALRDATLGHAGAWTAIGIGAALAAFYLCLGVGMLRVFVRLARKHATLSLT